jgi:hypothetical protein
LGEQFDIDTREEVLIYRPDGRIILELVPSLDNPKTTG